MGWFILFADEYWQLGKHTFSSALFFQNLTLISESGYFDSASDAKPLLHLWSLGIEEQFYIIWPLLLWLVYRLRFNYIIIIILLGLGSFVFNLSNVDINKAVAFYSPQSRFWELLLGAVLAYLHTFAVKDISEPKMSCLISISGALLILIATLEIDKNSLFPGWLAILPTLGAFLLIAAGPFTPFNKLILSNPFLVLIGLISYPLYLWHWSIISMARILQSGELNVSMRIAILIISLLLSYLTFRYFERHFRNKKRKNIKAIGLLLFMGLIAFLGHNIYSRNGLDFRSELLKNPESYFPAIPRALQSQQAEGYIEGFPCSVPEIPCGKQSHQVNKKQILVWGDSHAQMMRFGLLKELPNNWGLQLATQPGCQPKILFTISTPPQECDALNLFVSKEISELKPKIVLLAQRDAWNPQIADLLYAKLINMGVQKVLFLGKAPEWSAKLPKIVLRQLWHDIPQYSQASLNTEVIAINLRAKKEMIKRPKAHYIDMIDLLCNSNGCLTYLGDDPRTGLTSMDTNHLTPLASAYVAKNLIIPLLNDLQ